MKLLSKKDFKLNQIEKFNEEYQKTINDFIRKENIITL